MKKQLILAAALLLAVTPAFAQRAGDIFGGDLPQDYGNSISNKFEHQIVVDQMLNDPAQLEQFYSEEQITMFFAQAVVKVSFYPDGSYVAYARKGGEVAGVKLGKKKVDLGGRAWESDQWLLQVGEYAVPKRSQPVSLQLAAAGNEMAVDCMNRYERSDQTVTFYVGPMNGLRCIGLIDEEALPFDEVVRTADATTAGIPSPGS